VLAPRATRDVVLDPQLVAVAHAQRGVFSAQQAYDAGYTSPEIKRLRHRGVLVSVRRGVYTAASSWRALPPRERYLAELAALHLVVGAGAVVSHDSAGVVHGMSLLNPSPGMLHLTRPSRGASRTEAGVHHHVAELPDGHVSLHSSWRVTTLARTAVDIARESDLPHGVSAIDSALRLGCPPPELTDVVLTCTNWPGSRMAAHALGLADVRAANAGESWSRVELTRHGVAPSDIQRELYDDDGLVGIADFVWDPQRVVGELDGRIKYRVPEGSSTEAAGEVVWSEKRREDRIRALGYEVIRWVYADLYAPDRLAARVRQAFTRAAARRRTTA